MKMNKPVNWSMATLLFAFLTLPVIAEEVTRTTAAEIACPEFKDAEEALDTYLEAEMSGFRLEAGTKERMGYCYTNDDVIAWDLVKIIDSFSVDNCKGKKKGPDCFRLRYGVWGDVYPGQRFTKRRTPKYEEIEITISKVDEKWELKGWSEVPPLVTKSGMLRFLDTQKNTRSNKDWVKQLSDELSLIKE